MGEKSITGHDISLLRDILALGRAGAPGSTATGPPSSCSSGWTGCWAATGPPSAT